MIFTSVIIFFKERKKESYDFNLNSKETFILTNNWFMIFFLATVLIGTLYPIFLDVLTNAKISVGPGTCMICSSLRPSSLPASIVL